MSPLLSRSVPVFAVHLNGSLDNWYANNSYGIRPVINLDANVTLIGSGTTSDPYEVVGA